MVTKQAKTAVAICAAVLLFVSPAAAEAHAAINTSPTTSCSSLDSTDFATHAGNQIDSRLAGVATTTALTQYSTRGTSTSTPWIRNALSWTATGTHPLDFTGVSGWNDAGIGSGYLQGGTLISPRFIIAAAHFPIGVGHYVDFLDVNGNHVERKIIDARSIGSTDVYIEELDSDVPDSIAYYPIMASSTLSDLVRQIDHNLVDDVPIVVFDQEGKAIIQQWQRDDDDFIFHQPYTSGPRKDYSEDIVSGDSGQPGFLILDNQPVLLFAHYGTGAGPSYADYISEINSAMTSMGGGQQLTQYNPTCFTDYPRNHRPTWTIPTHTTFIHHIDTLPEVISTTAATDTDSTQTLTYSVQKILDDTSSTYLTDPSSYFSISSDGTVSWTRDFDSSILGHTLSLTVMATDNGNPVATTTTQMDLYYRSSLNTDASLTIDPHLNFANFALPLSSGTVYDLAFQPDGKMVAAGYFDSVVDLQHVDFTPQNSISRFSSDGYLDTTFATNIGTGLQASGSLAGVSKIFIDSNNKILIAGSQTTFNGTTTGHLTRLNSDGTLDATFTANAGAGLNGFGLTSVIQAGGKIFAVGLGANSYNGESTHGIAVINDDGTLDTDFYTNFGTINGSPKALYYDGTYVYLAGSFATYVTPGNATTTPVRLIRFTPDGTVDTTFLTNQGSGFDSTVNDVTVRPDGKIAVVGDFLSFNDEVDTHYVALLNSDGTIDADFSANAGTDFGSNMYAVLAEPDNKIVIGGNTSHPLVGFARLNQDGTSDEVFNNAVNSSFNGGVFHMARRSDGAIVTTGLQSIYGIISVSGSAAVFVTETPPNPRLSLDAASDFGVTGDNKTSTSTAVIGGQASSDGIVYVYEGNTLLATSTADINGIWQATTTLAEGVHSLTTLQSLTITTTATSSTSTPTTIIIDKTAPVVGTPSLISGTLSVPFNESLNPSATSTPSAWTVMVGTNAVPVTSVTATSGAITLNLASPVTNTIPVKVSYVPGSNPVSDAAGNAAAAFSLIPVTNNTVITTVVDTPASGGGGSSGGGGGGGSPAPAVTSTVPQTTANVPGCPAGYVCQATGTAGQNAASNPAHAAVTFSFTKDLSLGVTRSDVLLLQQFLNAQGFIVSTSGSGSPGHESAYFGAKTKLALIKFQAAHGIKPASGYFGPLTRTYIAKTSSKSIMVRN